MSEGSKDEFGQPLIPCSLCGRPTPMLGTKRCDRCWELERRIRSDPELACRVLAALDMEQLRESCVADSRRCRK